MNNRIDLCRRLLLLVSTILLSAGFTSAQTTAFNYQGKLSVGGVPADGNFDFEFRLYDLDTGGVQQGTTLTLNSVAVLSGSFSVPLDFGACPSCFNGANRYLEISVRPTGSGAFTALTPRQQMLSTPYSIKSLNAATADGLSLACVSCITSGQIQSVAGSVVTGAIPVASVPAASNNYINNTTTQQGASNFNISGDGTVGGTLSGYTVNAAMQFNLGGSRILSSNPARFDLFLGETAGASNTSGDSNAFFGSAAGANNTVGSGNCYFGAFAGLMNTAGGCNSFFGTNAGLLNTTGGVNSFFGCSAGRSNTSGSFNSFFGPSAGFSNTSATDNNFFGYQTGYSNTTGSGNSFFGNYAGRANLNANYNSFFGVDAGFLNTNGGDNSFFGAFAGVQNTTGGQNSFFGLSSGRFNATGFRNAFFGNRAGYNSTIGSSNTFIGDSADFNNDLPPAGDRNTLLGAGAIVNSGISNGTAIGSNALVTQPNSLVLGSIKNINGCVAPCDSAKVGIGTTSPLSRLHVHNNSGTDFALTLTNELNTSGHRGYRLAFDNDRFTFQRADDAGNWTQDQIAIKQETGNLGIGTTDPKSRLHLHDDSGSFAITLTNSGNTPGKRGYRLAFDNDRLSFQKADDVGNFIEKQVSIDPGTGNVGIGNDNPNDKLNVNGRVSLLLAGAGTTQVCQNASFQLAVCSSSLRYKQNILPFRSGLALVNQLHPVSFNWRQSGTPDMGLIAEEVAKIEPLLVTYNDKGEIEGVKYDRVGVVLINAISEQQRQIADQQSRINQQATKIDQLEQRIDLLTKLVDKLTRGSK